MGDPMRIESPFPIVHDSNWIGVGVCAAFVTRYHLPSSSNAKVVHSSIVCTLKVGEGAGCHTVAETVVTDGDPVELVHLCLVYFTRQEIMDFTIPANENIHDLSGFNFELLNFYSGYDRVSSPPVRVLHMIKYVNIPYSIFSSNKFI